MDAKELQLYCGGKVEIPHMALTLQKQHAILLYVDKCKKEGETPLSVSTLRRILDESKTSQRKALQGLDNYVVRGCSGIETLQQVTEKLQSLDASISTDADIKKIGPKRFLKNSYRKQMKMLQQVMMCIIVKNLPCLILKNQLPWQSVKIKSTPYHTETALPWRKFLHSW